jgi:hypothetical protein
MADEYARYATLIEARTSERHITGYGGASALVEPF